jgi:hypothetical protein
MDLVSSSPLIPASLRNDWSSFAAFGMTAEGPFAPTETVDIQVVPLGNRIFAANRQERDAPNYETVMESYLRAQEVGKRSAG